MDEYLQYLREGERLDDLQRGGFRLIQNEKLFCFGMDAVLLSAFARVREGERVLDLGTGSGIIPVLLRARTPGRDFTGLEIQEESVEMAQRSMQLNGLETEISIVRGDIREAGRIFPAASFHVVTSNPPYMTGGHGLIGGDPAVAAARHELLCSFEDVVRAAAWCLRSRGRFYLVHRPFRSAEIICCLCRHHLEPKRIRFVHPFADKEPNMVLIEAVKGGNPGVIVEKPLIVYETPGIYTKEVYEIYGMEG